MKVLWITNTLFPAVCKELNLPVPVVGGWMYSAAEFLIKVGENIELGVASLYNGKELRSFKIEGITYFLVPRQGKGHVYRIQLEAYWQDVQNQFVPDVVHIHGTEYPHGLAYVKGSRMSKRLRIGVVIVAILFMCLPAVGRQRVAVSRASPY